METSYETPTLFDYGAHNESTHIRAHVAVLAQTLYVFPTASAVAVMRNFKKASAYQPGVEGHTAEGHLVPWKSIPHIRALTISPNRLDGFTDGLSTTEKGERACAIVAAFLRAGRFPLWLDGDIIGDQEMQIQGVDILVKGMWKIQTKCDYRAGESSVDSRCTGNIFIQTAERNPLGRH